MNYKSSEKQRERSTHLKDLWKECCKEHYTPPTIPKSIDEEFLSLIAVLPYEEIEIDPKYSWVTFTTYYYPNITLIIDYAPSNTWGKIHYKLMYKDMGISYGELYLRDLVNLINTFVFILSLGEEYQNTNDNKISSMVQMDS